MFTQSVGSGRVVLFRDGKRIEGTWSRPSVGAPTTFTDAAGKPLLFAPGGTFVALVAPVPLPDQMIWLTTYSMLEMSFEMSSGSTAGNIPTRSWLRPSLR